MSRERKQELKVELYQLFRTAGFTLNTTQTEKLNELSDKLYKLIEAASKEQAVELVRRLQKAIGSGFEKIGKDMDALEAEIKTLKEQVNQ